MCKMDMMTSSNGNNFRVTSPWGENLPVTGGFPSQRPVTRSFDVFFDLRLNKRPSKQSRRQWFDAIVLIMTSLQWTGNIGACSLVRHTTVSRIGYAILVPVWLPYRRHLFKSITPTSLRWRQNGRDGVSNHQPQDCLLNRLFRRRSKKTSKLRVTGLCAGNSPGTGEFPAQIASNAENVSIWWRHHVCICRLCDKQESKT